jgi:hypothetical protein
MSKDVNGEYSYLHLDVEIAVVGKVPVARPA